jgi:hypothetical protein
MLDHEKVLFELVAFQKEKLLRVAKEIRPNVIEDDLMQPFDFPELENNPYFRHEEGVLEGLLTAVSALRAACDEITCLK